MGVRCNASPPPSQLSNVIGEPGHTEHRPLAYAEGVSCGYRVCSCALL